jgi:uncharacterized glyoxalase superfamily metalloenzyme YdcJ
VTRERAIRTLNLERLQKEKQHGTKRVTTPEEHKRENDLALSVDV